MAIITEYTLNGLYEVINGHDMRATKNHDPETCTKCADITKYGHQLWVEESESNVITKEQFEVLRDMSKKHAVINRMAEKTGITKNTIIYNCRRYGIPYYVEKVVYSIEGVKGVYSLTEIADMIGVPRPRLRGAVRTKYTDINGYTVVRKKARYKR